MCCMSEPDPANWSQKEIDEREWANPQNWHKGFYFSRRDSRTFVPKRRGHGTTVNFARRGVLLFFLLLLLTPVAIIGAVLLSRAF
jgi:uncharacterized membrane protein